MWCWRRCMGGRCLGSEIECGHTGYGRACVVGCDCEEADCWDQFRQSLFTSELSGLHLHRGVWRYAELQQAVARALMGRLML